MSATYDNIARSFALWGEFTDPYSTMTENEFSAITVEQRIRILTDIFGDEEMGE